MLTKQMYVNGRERAAGAETAVAATAAEQLRGWPGPAPGLALQKLVVQRWSHSGSHD